MEENKKEPIMNAQENEPLINEHYENNEDYIDPEIEKGIVDELKEFAKQTYESGKEVAHKVAHQVKDKAAEKSAEVKKNLHDTGKEMGNEVLSGTEAALDRAQEVTDDALKNLKENVEKYQQQWNEHKD